MVNAVPLKNEQSVTTVNASANFGPSHEGDTIQTNAEYKCGVDYKNMGIYI
jgi:hypothetical protein